MESTGPKRAAMDPAGQPVVEDGRLPRMGEDTGVDVMEWRPATPPAGVAAPTAAAPETVSATGENLMSESAPTAVAPGQAAEQAYPDMQPAGGAAPPTGDAADFAAGFYGEGYLRLLMEVDEGTMRVLEASVVDGPLVGRNLTGELAYQALVRGRRVGAEGLGDLTRQHAYAPPGEQVGHSVGDLTRYQFMVRIPRSEITASELADLEVELLRPRSTTELAEVAAALPAVAFADAAIEAGHEPPEVVARLAGVRLDALPAESAEAVRQRLR